MKNVRTGSTRVPGGLRSAGRLVATAAAALALVATTGAAANAAYYNSYTTVAPIPQSAGITGMQGFAAGSTYLYSIKIDSNPPAGTAPNSMIYRTDKDTGATQVMQNVQNSTAISTNPWLQHANDVALANYGDPAGHMFVLTGQDTGAQLVKLSYTGTTYKREASYNIFGPNGLIQSPTGISRVSIDASNVNFLFKDGSQIYRGSIALNAPGGADIHLTDAYSLDVSHAVVNGVDTDLSTWSPQGFLHYDPTADAIYTTVRKGTDTIVLVYPNVSTSTTNPRPAATDPSFLFTATSGSDSRAYTKHEFEGLALSGGKLYFSTNRQTGTTTVTPYDGVHVVNGYTA
jgi:hypothetical protein